MKSICIKTNNFILLDYLLNELDYIEIEPVYISSNEFKNYKNVIVHYRGNDDNKLKLQNKTIIDEVIDNFH